MKSRESRGSCGRLGEGQRWRVERRELRAEALKERRECVAQLRLAPGRPVVFASGVFGRITQRRADRIDEREHPDTVVWDGDERHILSEEGGAGERNVRRLAFGALSERLRSASPSWSAGPRHDMYQNPLNEGVLLRDAVEKLFSMESARPMCPSFQAAHY